MPIRHPPSKPEIELRRGLRSIDLRARTPPFRPLARTVPLDDRRLRRAHLGPRAQRMDAGLGGAGGRFQLDQRQRDVLTDAHAAARLHRQAGNGRFQVRSATPCSMN